jgi:hypothetical protein
MKPAAQVELLLSTLEKGGDIIPLEAGLEKRYKTATEFVNTPNHEAFENEKLIDLLLSRLKTADEDTIPSLLNLVRISGRIGSFPSFFFIHLK